MESPPEPDWIVLTESNSEIEVEMLITNLRSAGLRAVAELRSPGIPGLQALDTQRWHVCVHQDDEADAREFLRALASSSGNEPN